MKQFAYIVSFFLFLLGATLSQATDNTINISYVKSPLNMQMIVMKKRQLLEKNASQMGLSVKWYELNSGAKQAQALSSNDLDFGGVINTTSFLLAASEGSPIKIIAGVARPTEVFAVMSHKNGVTDIKELKGKTVAGPKGTVLYQTLVAALVKNTMSIDDINFIQMDLPKAFAALQVEKVDAALLAANIMLKAQQAGGHTLATAKGLTSPLLIMAATDNVIKNHPEWVDLVVKTHNESAKWIEEHPEEAIKLASEEQEIPFEDAQKLYNWSHFTQLLNQQDIKNMYTEMEFMTKNNMMRKKIHIEDFILPEAMEGN